MTFAVDSESWRRFESAEGLRILATFLEHAAT